MTEQQPSLVAAGSIRPWGPDGPTMQEWAQSHRFTCSPELLAEIVVGVYHGAITHREQEAPPMIQIKTPEGILTISNASDVRTTSILCVRGHRGVTLGYVAPLPAGGWVCMDDAQALEAYLDANTNLRDSNDVTLEQAAALLVTAAD